MANEKRLIDANALLLRVDESKRYNPHHDGKLIANHRNEHDHFFKLIYTAPTVDAVEVVRCKDCKHCEPAINSYNKKIMECQNSNGIWRKVKPDDFCSYGERRERGRMIDKFYKQICPFCRKDHEQRLHINIICHCGAKYYFNRGKWLSRQTGEWIQGEAIEIFEKKVRFDNA